MQLYFLFEIHTCQGWIFKIIFYIVKWCFKINLYYEWNVLIYKYSTVVNSKKNLIQYFFAGPHSNCITSSPPSMLHGH